LRDNRTALVIAGCFAKLTPMQNTEGENSARGIGKLGPGPAEWQKRWYEVIFEHDTPSGKLFDLLLLVVIVVSVAAVMLESVASLREPQPDGWGWGPKFIAVEWVITFLFSLEFLARLACVNRPMRYVFSFFGLVDIVSLLPSYIGLFHFDGAKTLSTIRTLRLLRVFRVLKLARHVKEAQGLLKALRHTWPKITVFISAIVCTIVILGTIMYIIEGTSDSGFDNIPVSVYWAIVTMTTVGYGDIAPVTALGKIVASLIMLLGYAIIIVPTGLFSAEIIQTRQDIKTAAQAAADRRVCPDCAHAVHALAASYCNQCGAKL